MLLAAGTLGRPGMVMMSPQTATTNSAPADRRTSRTVTTWSVGAPLESGWVEKLYCVLAMQTGTLPKPMASNEASWSWTGLAMAISRARYVSLAVGLVFLDNGHASG